MQRIIKNDQLVDETWHLLPQEQTLDDQIGRAHV